MSSWGFIPNHRNLKGILKLARKYIREGDSGVRYFKVLDKRLAGPGNLVWSEAENRALRGLNHSMEVEFRHCAPGVGRWAGAPPVGGRTVPAALLCDSPDMSDSLMSDATQPLLMQVD